MVGGGEFAAAIAQVGLQHGEAMGVHAGGADLLAQSVDLASPAGLVCLLAVLGQAGALQGGGELGVQLRDVTGGEGSRRRGCRKGEGDSPLKKAVDPGDPAAVPVTPLQFGAQFEARDGAASGSQLVDDLLDLGVLKSGRAGHRR